MKTRLKTLALLSALLVAPLAQAGDADRSARLIERSTAPLSAAVDAKIRRQLSQIDMTIVASMIGTSLPAATASGAVALVSH
ncbi:hypothetical protein D0B54_15180 [Solimonas sp. K1W22B-7]|uniref:hypothetical protein n=1 Tax=Solimonas sp. K1W22B-7 TaxID=2303331 RepID=UPI000E33139C|nr:hypothetical protein [Solimonas sp. K1W22B-7]AXQ29939.1 hypothetical protein D0B54_15180 [Solimonas sp. K1W22B-7]